MWRTWTVLLATLLAACGGKPTPGTSDISEWNEAATQEVRAQVQRTMAAFASADLEGFKSGLADDVVAFETDLESKPVRLGSRAGEDGNAWYQKHLAKDHPVEISTWVGALSEAGFASVGCFWRYLNFAIMSGHRAAV